MNRQGGFSLLEVLVAFVIMGLSLGALYQSVVGSVRNMAVSEQYTHAILLGRSLLMLHDHVPPEGFSDQGRTGDNYHWRLQTYPVPDTREGQEGDREDFLALEVTVEWPAGPRTRSVELRTVVPVGGGR